MKQKLRLLLLLLAAMVLTQTVKAATFTDGNLTYETTSGTTAKVTGYVAAPIGDLVIPATVTDGTTNYNVTAIADGKDKTTGVFHDCTGITSVVLPEGMKSVAKFAFYKCSGITSVTIPESVTGIDVNAFLGCSKLTSVDLPDNLITIGNYAFNNCSGLTSIDIPASVTSLGKSSFKGAKKLASVTFNSTTAPVAGDNTVFNSTPTIHVPEGSAEAYSAWTVFASGGAVVDDVVLDPSTQPVIPTEVIFTFTVNTDGTTATITGYDKTGAGLTPSDVLKIPATVTDENGTYTVTAIADAGAAASGAFFQCQQVTSVELPEGLTTIGKYAFQQCTKLASINFPASLTAINLNAFMKAALTSIDLPDNLQTIGQSAFSGCSVLTEVDIPASVTTIGNNAFADTGITTATLNWESDIVIAAGTTFGTLTGLTINIPGGTLAKYTTMDWDKYGTLVDPEAPTDVILTYEVDDDGNATVTGYDPKGALPSGTLTIPRKVVIDGTEYNVTSIKAADKATDGAFYNCKTLESVELPENLQTIGKYAFQQCPNLGSVYLPQALTTIGMNAFYGCPKLADVELPINLINIESKAFASCTSLTSVSIPFSIKKLAAKAFDGCSSLAAVYFNWVEDANVITCPADGVFGGISSSAILYVPETREEAYDAKGWNVGFSDVEDFSPIIDFTYELVTTDGGITTAVITGYNRTVPSGTLTIPRKVVIDGTEYPVTAIADVKAGETTVEAANGVFYAHKYITKVILPEGFVNVGKYAFQQCPALAEIHTSSTLQSIGINAFQACRSLTEIDLAEGLLNIGQGAFAKCTSLTSINLPASIADRSYMTSDGTEKDVPGLGQNAFMGCTGLSEVYFNDTNIDGVVLPITDNPDAGIFYNIAEQVTLYVPIGCVEGYEGTTWGTTGDFDVITEFGDLVLEQGVTDRALYDYAKYGTITINPGAEVNASEVIGMTVQAVEVIKTFSYTANAANATKEWFSLGLPFEVAAGNNQIWKLEDDGTYVVAEANTDFATFDYNGERRRTGGTTGLNWDMYLANSGNIGEVMQFPELGTYTYKFVSADSDAALDALMNGREGNKYFDADLGDDDNNGWNVVPAGKTYSTSYTDNIAGVTIAQEFDGTTGYFKTGEVNATYAPGTVFTIQLTEQSTDYISTNSESDAEVETYGFELIDNEGDVIDRIYLFDGSNRAQYRVGKMGAFSASAPQMCIRANDKKYCAYSSLASEADKSYTVSFANIPEGSQLVMTKAGAQSVTVDDAATALDAAVDVADGNINITIGSQTTSVSDAAATAKVYGVDGAIIIEGANGAYSVVNMSGVAVATGVATGNTAVNLPAGIYVVNAAGEYSKVIVK